MAKEIEKNTVQIPAAIQMERLGYKLILNSELNSVYNIDTRSNILKKTFIKNYMHLNRCSIKKANEVYDILFESLSNNDLGKSFYEHLSNPNNESGDLIDFKNIENNEFHYTLELEYFKDTNYNNDYNDNNCRPDLTLFINGLPLVFAEFKRMNNINGVNSESQRLNTIRNQEGYRRFQNITQFYIASNNLPYDVDLADDKSDKEINGSFYGLWNKTKNNPMRFREENIDFFNNFQYKNVENKQKEAIIKELHSNLKFNVINDDYLSFQENDRFDSETNSFLTSLVSKERLLKLIKYGIVYIDSGPQKDGLSFKDKNIIRYHQFFTMLKVGEKILQGERKGIIWHTQGSGKTALTYHIINYLTDLLSQKSIVPKFYFIVDRLDLLNQASQEFNKRNLITSVVNSRKQFKKLIESKESISNNKGGREVTILNIHKIPSEYENKNISFEDAKDNLNGRIQRIFIVDEAHRSYNLEGSFFKNLLNADKNAIKLALTGTPILNEEKSTKELFGNYIHVYYYDKSVQDKFTLKIQHIIKKVNIEHIEGIEDNKHIKAKEVNKRYIFENQKLFKKYLQEVIVDFNLFRKQLGNDLGGMMICYNNDQATAIYNYFKELKNSDNETLNQYKPNFEASLILSDDRDDMFNSDLKEEHKKAINEFKLNKGIDLLIVNKMLLTGFDAGRLKRLYIGRELKDHNLLQAITRVNRPYVSKLTNKSMDYGYVVDFIDNSSNLEEAKISYIHELEKFNSQEGNITLNDSIFIKNEEIIDKLTGALDNLLQIDWQNSISITRYIAQINNKNQLYSMRNSIDVVLNFFDNLDLIKNVKYHHIIKYISQDNSKLKTATREINARCTNLSLKETKQLTKEIFDEVIKNIEIEFEDYKQYVINLGIATNKEKQYYEVRLKINAMKEFSAELDDLDSSSAEHISFKEKITQILLSINNSVNVKDYDKVIELAKYFDVIKAEHTKIETQEMEEFNSNSIVLKAWNDLKKNEERKMVIKNILINFSKEIGHKFDRIETIQLSNFRISIKQEINKSMNNLKNIKNKMTLIDEISTKLIKYYKRSFGLKE